MVAGLVVPDITAAMIAILLADADVTALTGRRISAAYPESPNPAKRWPMPTFAILLRRAGGPPDDEETDRSYARFDIRWFGAGENLNTSRREAMRLWRTGKPVLCPPRASGLPMGRHIAGCLIDSIREEAAPFPGNEPGTDWGYALSSYIVRYAMGALAA